MSKVLATVLTLLAILAGSSVFAAEQTRTLKVDKMTCATCPLTVSIALSWVDGVTKVDVDFDDKTAIVTFDDAATTLEAVAQASTDVGFPAHPVTDTSPAE